MSWSVSRGVLVWTSEPFPDPSDAEMTPYRFCAVPVAERPHPTCGKPGNGRDAHSRRGEPACELCRNAERLYASWRREVIPA